MTRDVFQIRGIRRAQFPARGHFAKNIPPVDMTRPCISQVLTTKVKKTCENDGFFGKSSWDTGLQLDLTRPPRKRTLHILYLGFSHPLANVSCCPLGYFLWRATISGGNGRRPDSSKLHIAPSSSWKNKMAQHGGLGSSVTRGRKIHLRPARQ